MVTVTPRHAQRVFGPERGDRAALDAGLPSVAWAGMSGAVQPPGLLHGDEAGTPGPPC